MDLLEVKGLSTVFESSRLGRINTLESLDLTVREGEILGVVGETAAGKTVLLRTILGVLHPEERVEGGEVRFRGEPLPILDEDAMRRFRGSDLSLILSGQRARLDPVRRIGDQLSDVMAAHGKLAKGARVARARDLLDAVGIPDSAHQLHAYPHELSGGMCQRIVIALGLANSPQLLMADEPTAGLDVTIQIQILDLFRALVSDTGAASILATRDLAQAAHYCNRIVVLRSGRVVEESPVRSFFSAPKTEHSRYLLKAAMAARGVDEDQSDAASHVAAVEGATPGEPLLEVRDLIKHYGSARRTVHAVNGVSFSIEPGRTLALVGESGSGKTTIGRCIAGLVKPTSGSIRLLGREVGDASARKRSERPELETHVVFQEPRESLNPRWTLGMSIEEPLIPHGDLDKRQRVQRVAELVEQVGLPAETADLYPHQTTAGVQQRVATARAIAVKPRLVVLDEPTSALDSSVKAQMIELLIRLQRELAISYLFISHDMTAVKMIAHDIAIMYLGLIFEAGPASAVFERQLNPYGRALLSSVLYPDPYQRLSRFRLEGEIPSAINLPQGCALSTRCPLAQPWCKEAQPPLEPVADAQRLSACVRNDEIVAAGSPDALRDRSPAPATLGG